MRQVVIIYKGIEYKTPYLVSNIGEVFRNNKKLKPSIGGNGYYAVNIVYETKKGVTKPIHRLVATAFIPNPENKREVNHINGNKLDNRVENLEWATPKENTQHAIRTGLMTLRDMALVHKGWQMKKDEIIAKQSIRVSGEGNPVARLKEQDIVLIREMYKNGLTIMQISRELNLKRMIITDAIKGVTWKCVALDYSPPKRLRGYPVLKIKNGEIVGRYDKISDAVKDLNKQGTHSPISACCRGLRKSYMGFNWQYDKQE